MGYQYWPDEFPSEYRTPLLVKTSRKRRSLRERIPARYVLTLLTFLGLGIQYTQRVNLNVTMVAMVNTSFIEGKENDTTLDECPNLFAARQEEDDNATRPVVLHQEVKRRGAVQEEGKTLFHRFTRRCVDTPWPESENVNQETI